MASSGTSAAPIERAVETNQRHLIKKILARYPSQWTFFRELVQNADDACAKNVTIEFETVKETKAVQRTTVSNDGHLFTDEDWSRLTSIASGNPAVDKIGFFGVGFYCVFSLSDNPTVSSGMKRLEFFWKGNGLYTRESTQLQSDNWTRFYLPVENLENAEPPPDFNEIGGFLAELLCFTRFIRSVKVFCDGVLEISAVREDEFSIPMKFPDSLTHDGDDSLLHKINRSLGRNAPVKFLAKRNASSVSRTRLSMSRHNGPGVNKVEETSISFVRAQGVFHSQLSDFNARAYHDMTQKSHPPLVTLSLLASLERKPSASNSNQSSLFLYNKLSPLGGRGRVFVGFITSQTVGSIHVGGPFVPTMERENLDFATPVAKDWNLALFFTVGTLARTLHEVICTNPETFHVAKQPTPEIINTSAPANDKGKQDGNESASSGFSLFNVFKKASSMFTAFAQDNGLVDVDEEQIDDNALFSGLEEKTGAIVATSMAIFSPLFTDCRPYAGVAPQIWRGFLAKEFEDGPRVWSSNGKAMSSDKCRLFPSPQADLPQLSTIETFPVVPMIISRNRPVGYRNIGGLASAFVEKLKEDGQIVPFDLGDIVSELQKRPLRGLQETLSFMEWFFKPISVQMINVRCGNCGAQTRIRSTTTEFVCSSCRYRLVYNNERSASPSNQDTTREQHLKKVLISSATCILDSGKTYKLGSWKYKLDGKLEPHLDLVRVLLPTAVLEQVCPTELTSRASVDLSFEAFTPSKLLSVFYSTVQLPLSSESADKCWRIIHFIWKFFPQDRDSIVFLQSKPVIPTKLNSLAEPKLCYTVEIADTHNEQVQIMAALPQWLTADGSVARAFHKFLINELGCRESLSPAVMVQAFIKGNLPRTELWRFIRDRVIDGKEKLDRETLDTLKKSKCLGRVVLGEDGKASGMKASAESYLPSQLLSPSPAVIALNDEDVPVVFLEEEDAAALIPFLQRYLDLKPPNPSRDTLLRIAASEKRTTITRLRALSMWVQQEDPSFDFSHVSQPIVPCRNGAWAPPSQCFLEVPSFLLAFDPSLKVCALDNIGLAKRLGVKALPPVAKTVQYLEKTSWDAKTDEDFATKIEPALTHLAERQGNELNETELTILSKLHVIPVPKGCVLRDRGMIFAEPRSCFFDSSNQHGTTNSADGGATAANGGGFDDLKVLFCFLDDRLANKSPKHRTFFRSIGVRDAPSLSELTSQLATGAKETLARIGKDNYLNLLRSIASDFAKVKPAARAELAVNSCFLGCYRAEPVSDGPSGIQGQTEEEWGLFMAGEICIEDDSRYRRLFPSIPSCPVEPSLEQMYLRCGSSNISDLVQETSSVDTSRAAFTKEAALVEKRLCERIPVLIQKVPQDKLREDRVKSWSEAALQRRRAQFDPSKGPLLVMQVPFVKCELRVTFKKQVRTKMVGMSACILNRILFVTESVDYFHVASSLVAEFSRVRSNDRALLWATLLQSTKQSLEEMGFVLPKDEVIAPSTASNMTTRLKQDSDDSETSSDDEPPKSSTIAPKSKSVTPSHKDHQPPPTEPLKRKTMDMDPPATTKPVESSLVKKPDLAPVPPRSTPFAAPPHPPAAASVASALANASSSLLPSKPSFPNGAASSSLTSSGTTPPTPSTSVAPVPRPPPVGMEINKTKMDPNRFRSSAIQAALERCRPTDAPNGQIVSPPTKTVIGDPMIDCTEHHDLYQADGIGSIECYVQRGSTTPQPFTTHMDKGREMSNLLLQLSIEVFALDCSVIHLYWDERGSSRAFNRAGSLFFNLHSFVQDSDTVKSGATWKRWFGTMAHELTHNLHAQHDAQFANFLELFCVEFADKFLYALQVRGLL